MRRWSSGNNQIDALKFQKYEKRVIVTEVTPTTLTYSDITEFYFSFVKVKPVQAASTILVRKELLLRDKDRFISILKYLP